MATSFFYIYVMATSFCYIYIDIYIDIDIDIYFDIYFDLYITFTNWRRVQSFYQTPFFVYDIATLHCYTSVFDGFINPIIHISQKKGKA